MKTPREILLQHHQTVTPKLDRVRRVVVADLNELPTEREQNVAVALALNLWLELIWTARRIWAGFAAVWLVILVINLTNSEPREMASDTTAPPSTEVLMAREQQRRLLTELIQSMWLEPAEPPRRSPQPRSERQLVWVIG